MSRTRVRQPQVRLRPSFAPAAIAGGQIVGVVRLPGSAQIRGGEISELCDLSTDGSEDEIHSDRRLPMTLRQSDELGMSAPRLAVQRREAAEVLGIGVDTFDRHVRAELPVVYVGSVRLYPLAALEDWLASNAHRGARLEQTAVGD